MDEPYETAQVVPLNFTFKPSDALAAFIELKRLIKFLITVL
jgi:hypothetical protein